MAPTEACVLEKVGNNGKPKDAYPLGRGEADCDYYTDCETGLLCFERGEYNYHIPVPGCTGDLYKYKYTDYCCKYFEREMQPVDTNRYLTDALPLDDPNDIPAKTLWYVGNDHHPDFVFPLAECHGDCDTNDDCQGTLKCFQRSGKGKGKGSYYSHQYDQVPGCSGYAEKYVDYCCKYNRVLTGRRSVLEKALAYAASSCSPVQTPLSVNVLQRGRLFFCCRWYS